MTANQKKLWDMLPIGEWVERNKIHYHYGKFNFQLALTFLATKNLISFEFRGRVQYIRRKTIQEMLNDGIKV